MTVWVLEKVRFDRYGFESSGCWTFLGGKAAHAALVEDFHEEYAALGHNFPPDENQGPFDTDNEATLTFPNDSGRIEWYVHETETEGEENGNRN